MAQRVNDKIRNVCGKFSGKYARRNLFGAMEFGGCIIVNADPSGRVV